MESFSGILLLVATILALIWANSSWGDSYQTLWHYKIDFTSDSFELNKPLILWINDHFLFFDWS
ncbi:Na+/H+ antiporter NhaA [Gelidibacter salicanalis]|uniref:Na+/H+ antiporter NhaA n=1 Tax=Gelidibacter salicanalis TaxID=291193 RepID=A0A934KT79_9FLAO|nr:Na+/H+ antiporter NhaA [Gelidibacter salicanalis]